jgi:predicted kinase
VILLLNGAFGIGKTTVARLLRQRLTGAVLYDPEIIGIALQRAARLGGVRVDDFQDLKLWRRLTVHALRVTRGFRRNVIVPMAISNPAYLEEIRSGIARFEPHVVHFCLTAPMATVEERLATRRLEPRDRAWQHRRAAECCVAHAGDAFAVHVPADRTPQEIAEDVLVRLRGDSVSPSQG